jgi:hypothetical protein
VPSTYGPVVCRTASPWFVKSASRHRRVQGRAPDVDCSEARAGPTSLRPEDHCFAGPTRGRTAGYTLVPCLKPIAGVARPLWRRAPRSDGCERHGENATPSEPDLQCGPQRWVSASTLDARATFAHSLRLIRCDIAGYPAFESRFKERIDSGLVA